MSDVLAILVLVAGFAVVLGGVAWGARRIRRSRKATSAVSGAMAAYSQAYQPHAYEAHIETTSQEQRPAETSTSEDVGRSLIPALGHPLAPR
ncbi:MAG: hypothetical protein ACRD0P_10835 [Stackebrandtia sp.]